MLLKRIAVIGLGNTLRRDDGIGVRILESLLKFYKRKGIDYFNFGIASFDLINRLGSFEEALLIDGINAGLASGELKICALNELDYKPDTLANSTHALDLKSLFGLAGKLNLKTKIYVAGIQVEDTSFGEALSRTLENKQGEIVKKISVFIDENFL